MFTPKKKNQTPAQQSPSPMEETQISSSKAPPPFELTASGEAPAQMVAGPEDDAFSPEVQDVLKDDKESPGTETSETAEKEVEAVPEPPVAVVPPGGVFEVNNEHAFIRKGPPEFKRPWPREKIYKGAKIRVLESMTKEGVQYSKVIEELGGTIGAPCLWGWTQHDNLTLSTPPTKEETAENEAAFAKQSEEMAEKIASGDMDVAEIQDYELDQEHAESKKLGEWNGTTFNNFLLEEADIDTDTFWGDFTSIELFGKQANSLHKDFANLLKNVERITVAKVVESEDFKEWQAAKKKSGTNAATVGQFLGIHRFSTIRTEKEDSTSSSFHMYGMAIDFNANNNPWISDSGGKMGKVNVKNKKGETVEVDSKTQQLRDTLVRMGDLTGETLEFDHVGPDSDDYDMMEMFDNSVVLDEAFEKYFSYVDGGNEAELTGLVTGNTRGVWNGKSVADAQKVIEADFDAMTTLWKRKHLKSTTKKHGIMDLDRRVLQAMNSVGLDWGGKYGDMMHFDMRFKGLGAKIRKAKNSKAGKKKKREMSN